MAVLQLPLQTVLNTLPDTKFTVVLEGDAYDIRMQWNTRDTAWEMSIGRQSLTPTVITKITTNSNILRPYRAYANIPDGELRVLDIVKKNGRIERDSFSSGRFVMVYITSDSVEALADLALASNDNRVGIYNVSTDGRFFTTPSLDYGIPTDGIIVVPPEA